MEELTDRNIELKSSVMERNRLWSGDTRPWGRRPSFFILVLCPHVHRRVRENRGKPVEQEPWEPPQVGSAGCTVTGSGHGLIWGQGARPGEREPHE